MPFTYPYPRPSVTADVVVFTLRADDLAVLLIQRRDEPFKGHWALPGGFVNENEALERAAARELYEETGVTGARIEQLGAFGDPGRDPRGHTVTVAFTTFLAAPPTVNAGDDAAAAEFKLFRTLVLEDAMKSRAAVAPPLRAGAPLKKARGPRGEKIHLAFDHAKIIARAYRKLCRHLDDPVHDASFSLVPPRFSLGELRRIYEIVLGRSIPQKWFKDYLLKRDLVVLSSTTTKPAEQLYKWNKS